MKITLNGETSPSGMVCITRIPNILTIESNPSVGKKASLVINAVTTSVDPEKEYYITINGVTIRSSKDWSSSSKFYVAQGASSIAMASSVVKALRATSLITNYDIYQQTSGNNLVSRVILEAKNSGSQYNIEHSSNLNSWTFSTVQGYNSDEFSMNQFYIDLYRDDEYITTLSKLYYKDSISFNISSILNDISEYDRLTPYSLIISATSPNSVRTLANLKGLYSTIGYMCNQGESYFKLKTNKLAQNVSRGERKQLDIYNKTVLYTYNPSIPISIYSTSSEVSLNIEYVDSNDETLYSETQTYPVNGYDMTVDIPLDRDKFTEASFIDVSFEGIVGSIRYTIIKPLDATARCQRIFYHNSYGGISFFDFTGQKTESHKTENELYNRNIYTYYTDDMKESAKVYNKENSITVTIKSHLMEDDARWQFNDLLGSYDVWTNINGVDYKIIIESCAVEQVTTGVWEATVTYTYSYI